MRLSALSSCFILVLLFFIQPSVAEDDAYRIGSQRCPSVSFVRPDVVILETQEQFEAVRNFLLALHQTPEVAEKLSTLSMVSNWPSGLNSRRLVQDNVGIFSHYRSYLIGTAGEFSLLFIPKAENTKLPAEALPEGDFFCALVPNSALTSPLPEVSQIQESAPSQPPQQSGGGLVLPVSVGDAARQQRESTAPPKVIEKTLGMVHVLYVEPPESNKFARQFHEIFSSNDALFTQFAFDFERTFKLPRRLDIVLVDLPDTNCWYSPKEHRVVMTYNMMKFFWQCAEMKRTTDPGELARFSMSCAFAVFFHEMAHAIIGEMEIPIVGREEDAADEFSSLWMLKSGDSAGEEIIGHTIDFFNIMGAGKKELAFWDEHSLDQQRVFSLLLILYAHNPPAYEKLVAAAVPEQSMARARYELPQKKVRWNKLLQPYMKPEYLKNRKILFP